VTRLGAATGFEPAGQRDVSSELFTGQRDVALSADLGAFVDPCAFVELSTGQRDVALSAVFDVFDGAGFGASAAARARSDFAALLSGSNRGGSVGRLT
jgi:hypothetical protein